MVENVVKFLQLYLYLVIQMMKYFYCVVERQIRCNTAYLMYTVLNGDDSKLNLKDSIKNLSSFH